jgi:hypothetical protein
VRVHVEQKNVDMCHPVYKARFAFLARPKSNMNKETQNSDAMKYVRSLKDAVKRRFAVAYLAWIRAGRIGTAPSRGVLSPILAKAVAVNLDALG